MSSPISAAQQKAELPVAGERIHRVLLIESNPRLRRFWETALTDGGFQVAVAATPDEALRQAAQLAPHLVFLGTGLDGSKAAGILESLRQISPDLSVVAPANPKQVREELDAMESHGAVTPNSALKVDQVKIAVSDALSLERLRLEREGPAGQEVRPAQFEQIVGTSQQTQALRRAITEAIQADPATVLILGETGTGKALVARAIHCNGLRQKKPFVVVECTAMPAALLESELFGYEAGAFTDARASKKGLLEVAEGGTVFLDEIGDLEMPVQAKLLRVLEDKRARRLGGTQDYAANVRFVAATNRPLETLVREGRFRQDLYFRLNVFHISVGPLRERKEDVVSLARHFVEQFSRSFHKQVHGLSFAAQQLLAAYDWPGNVRELRNIIERAVILEKGELISPQHLVLGAASVRADDAIRLPEGGIALEEVEKTLVAQALEKTSGNQTEAAKLLKITRFALRTRMKKFALL
jgi:two-component system, NtrC family, response regulator AtoC